MARFLGDNFLLVFSSGSSVVFWLVEVSFCWCYSYRGAVGYRCGVCVAEGLMCACVLRGVFDSVEW